MGINKHKQYVMRNMEAFMKIRTFALNRINLVGRAVEMNLVSQEDVFQRYTLNLKGTLIPR